MTTRPRCHTLLATVILAAVPSLSMGQVTLTELGAANAARNQMMANSAGTASGAAPAAATPAVRSSQTGQVVSSMKYTLSYALFGALVGLGLYLVCRPAHRHACD